MNILEANGLSAMNLTGMSALSKSGAKKADEREEAERLGRIAANQGDSEYDKKLRGVAEDFVSVFMTQVMKSMRSTVQENPMMHGDNGEKFFREMLDTEHAGQLAKGSGYGLTDLVYQALAAKGRVQPATVHEDAAPESVAGISGAGLE